MRDFYSGLVELAVDLLKKVKSKNLILTLNKDGVLIQTLNRKKFSTDKIPSLALDVKDVAGAGDAMLISSALSMISGGSIWVSSYLGSIASALEIKKVGNVPLRMKELAEEVNKI
jgi:bifunctional ADP-heptose synthase (sugar kinase/adenylyltransferase)